MIEKAIETILSTDKKILYTYGWKWKNPTTYKVPVTKEEAVEIIKAGHWAHFDLTDKGDYLDLNLYSANDML